MIKLSPLAVEKIKEFAADQGFSLIVRIGVLGGGCVGFQYNFEFVEDVKDTDEVFENNGIKVIIDPISYQYLQDIEVDYENNGLFAGFKFNNPNAKGSCGCGSSFYT